MSGYLPWLAAVSNINLSKISFANKNLYVLSDERMLIFMTLNRGRYLLCNNSIKL